MSICTDTLRVRSRRGMLELDLLLGRFLETQYAQLSADEQAVFAKLLELEDTTLYSYLFGQLEPDAIYLPLLRKIKKR